MPTAFAKAGMNVMLNGLSATADVDRTRRMLSEEFGVEVGYSPADMSKPADIEEMVEEARRAFGPLDVLVNNAGIQHVAPIGVLPWHGKRRRKGFYVREVGTATKIVAACYCHDS